MWWENAVVYQVYPRSFQDADGDGNGDLRGIRERLGHIADLGADAVWLSPIYPSPNADWGYDVADFTAVDPDFGTLEDFDELLADVHRRGLRLLMDLVPCHTSIEHAWFRERPDFYVRRRTGQRPNNWIATFGGPAWSRVPGEPDTWYLHSFYPEQPDLDWRNPQVVSAMQDAMRFWLDRGVDGFRLDALDRLLKDPDYRDDPPATAPGPFPLHADHGSLDHVHSLNAPDIGTALAALREAAGEKLLVGEVFLPTAELAPYLEHLDVSFAFELYFADWEPAAVRAAIAAAEHDHTRDRLAWVLSNHDFPRLPGRVGPENVRAAATLLLTLPGCVFVYQGDELGQSDGPPGVPPRDRAGRDPFRTPMAWDPGPATGFTSGTPWLPPQAPPAGTAAEQAGDERSPLALYRRLIALRHEHLRGPLRFVESHPDVLAFARGEHVVAINFAAEPRPRPPAAGATTLLQTGDHEGKDLGAREGLVANRTG